MQNLYCSNCGATRGFKRSLGVGTILAVVITGGVWLFLLPLYPKRCIVCGSKGGGGAKYEKPNKVKYKKPKNKIPKSKTLESSEVNRPVRVKTRICEPLVATIEISTNFEPSVKSNVSPDSVWIPKGKAVKVSGYNVDCGLLYYGKELAAVSGWGIEPALINPKLKVDKSAPDTRGRNMSYWPSYSEISATSRSAYLEWLASKRDRPDTYIGYIFLYFYGLERRALIDLQKSSKAKEEIPLIKAEVERLLSIYGSNGSFRNYAASFLDTLNALYAEDKVYKGEPPSGFTSYDFPAGLKLGLGQLAKDGIPLPAEWALAWVESRPYFNLRTPANRCHDEFQQLFNIRYKEKYGAGLSLKPGKDKLTVSYHAASSSLRGHTEFALPEVPDVSADDRPLAQLSALAEECTNELDAYSRFLGRNQGKQNSIEAMALLPTQILTEAKDYKELDSLNMWLSETVNDEIPLALIAIDDLFKQIPSMDLQNARKKEMTAVAQILSKLKVGVEPDVRFGAPALTSGQVALFLLPENSAVAPSPEYSAASVILHLAAAVSGADGNVPPEEERHLEEQLESWLHLNEDEQIRLRAHTHWLLASTLKLTGLKKRLALLKPAQREAVGKFLVGVAQADGYIDPEEIKTLTKIYKLLELNPKDLFSHAHAAASEPETISTGIAPVSDHSIPSVLSAEEGSSLNADSVQKKWDDTTAVTELLKGIFEEEETQAAKPVEERSGGESVFGLSPEQTAFMLTLAQNSEWSREELELLAADSNLLLDGALDSVNDASFEKFDEPFFDGEDPIEINQKVAKELSNARYINPA